MQHLAIVGGGTAGTTLSARLAARLDRRAWAITVFDRDDAHLYQPGLLFVPFGGERRDRDVRSRRAQLAAGVELVLDEVVRIDRDARVLGLASGATRPFDLLVIASGAQLAPGAVPGLAEAYAAGVAGHFYDLPAAEALHRRLASFDGGHVVVNIAELPIKCPVAPHEFTLLLESWLRGRGLRGRTTITFATPLAGAFTKPVASAVLGDLMGRRGITVAADFALADVDPVARVAHAYDGRALAFDLLVAVPPHRGNPAVAAAGLGDEDGWLRVDRHTLQSTVDSRVFGLGDGVDVPTSKAGAVAHFQAEVLEHNLLRVMDGLPPDEHSDGHANCFIETGDGKAMLIDFNYDTEPLPGKFPLPGLGPFSLLAETEFNHWGKLGFRWVYWNLLLRGSELPLDHRMLLAGKRSAGMEGLS